MILETERLLLKPFGPEEAELVLALYNSPEFLHFVGDRNIRNEEDAVRYIQEKMEPQMKKLGFGNYAVILKSSGEKIGGAGIYARENQQVMDIGFSLLPGYTGYGYAYEAADFLIEHVKLNFGLEKIAAFTREENTASRTLIEKLGLRYVKKAFITDEPKEFLYYEKLVS